MLNFVTISGYKNHTLAWGSKYIIKMSFLLNVSSISSKSVEFSLIDIEVLVDGKKQPWFKRAHIRKYLVIEDIKTSLSGLEKCKMLTRQEFKPTRRTTPG